MLKKLICWFVAFAITMTLSSVAVAASVKTEHVEAELISRHTSVKPGQPIEAALRLKIKDHWHTYWRNPGDSGLPTKITWSLPEGFSAAPIQWPFPKKLPLGPLMNFGYEGEILHLVDIATPAGSAGGKEVTLRAKADWLVCSDVCIPESADLALKLPVSAAAPAINVRWSDAFSAAHAALPTELKTGVNTAQINGAKLVITGTNPPDGDVTFYPYRDDVIANAGVQTLIRKQDNGFSLEVAMADPVNKDLKSLEGILVAEKGWGTAHAGKAMAIAVQVTYGSATPTASAPGLPATSSMTLLPALLLAFVGGLILNLMPCVFPVLGIKIMGFVQHAQSDSALLKKQGFAFLAGVVISFWVLAGLLIALRTAGQAIGWGFQLQSPVFVTLLAVLFLLMALNLSGVFEMGLRLQTAAGNLEMQPHKNPLIDAFLSGVLATIVATPCTAPFMGAALGFTLSQPAFISMLVFTSIALGMSVPIVLLSLMPRWLSYLPRPGAWMSTFKQLMAFPLFATVAWLAWVIGSQLGNDGVAKLLFGLVVIALAAWAYGHWQVAAPRLAMVVGALLAAGGLSLAWPDPTPQGTQAHAEADWVPFSKQKIAELRSQGKGVFVDFTATWCITCQVNKRVALNQPEVIKRFAEAGVVRMKADWTVQDPVITATLAEFGRNGVPLYVFYPKSGEPRVLPEVLTPAIVLSAIEVIPGKIARE